MVLADEVDDKTIPNGILADATTPSPAAGDKLTQSDKVEVLAVLPGRHASMKAALADGDNSSVSPRGDGDIVALRQGNVFGTSFHPELTDDFRIHIWWLSQILRTLESS